MKTEVCNHPLEKFRSCDLAEFASSLHKERIVLVDPELRLLFAWVFSGFLLFHKKTSQYMN